MGCGASAPAAPVAATPVKESPRNKKEESKQVTPKPSPRPGEKEAPPPVSPRGNEGSAAEEPAAPDPTPEDQVTTFLEPMDVTAPEPSKRAIKVLEQNVLSGYPEGVTAVVLSCDGTSMVSASTNDAVWFWSRQEEKPNRYNWNFTGPWRGHTGSIQSLSLSQDGRRLVSASADGSVGVWQYPGGAMERLIDSGSTRVLSVAIAGDGKTVVSGLFRPDALKVWDAGSGALLHKLAGQEGSSPTAVAISHDGTWVVSGSEDGVVRVWQLPETSPKFSFTGHTKPVTSLALSLNGTTLYSGSKDGTLRVWGLPQGYELHTLNLLAGAVTSLTLLPGADLLVTGANGSICIWDTRAADRKPTMIVKVDEAHEGAVTALSLSGDGHTLMSGSADKQVKVWKVIEA